MPIKKDLSDKSSYVIAVTGANKGIGKAIVRQIVLQGPKYWGADAKETIIYLTARNQELGEKALKDAEEELKDAELTFNVRFHTLDILNKESIENFARFLKERHDGLDVLINNAGMAFKGDAFNYEVIRTTLNTNYYGTLNMMNEFAPLIRNRGRLINISSFVASLKKVSPEIQSKLVNPKLTVDELTALMEEYAELVKEGTYKEKGWPQTAYGVSKIGVTGLSKVFGHKYGEKFMSRACCPGYVNTDMTSGRGHLTVDEGAETPVYIALAPYDEIMRATSPDDLDKGYGTFWSEKKPQPW